jgi:hypothetical protein
MDPQSMQVDFEWAPDLERVYGGLIPVIGFAPRLYHWLGTRRINRLHRELGKLERELARGGAGTTLADHQIVVTKIEGRGDRDDEEHEAIEQRGQPEGGVLLPEGRTRAVEAFRRG